VEGISSFLGGRFLLLVRGSEEKGRKKKGHGSFASFACEVGVHGRKGGKKLRTSPSTYGAFYFSRGKEEKGRESTHLGSPGGEKTFSPSPFLLNTGGKKNRALFPKSPPAPPYYYFTIKKKEDRSPAVSILSGLPLSPFICRKGECGPLSFLGGLT